PGQRATRAAGTRRAARQRDHHGCRWGRLNPPQAGPMASRYLGLPHPRPGPRRSGPASARLAAMHVHSAEGAVRLWWLLAAVSVFVVVCVKALVLALLVFQGLGHLGFEIVIA